MRVNVPKCWWFFKSKTALTGDHKVSETQSPCWSGGSDGTSEQREQFHRLADDSTQGCARVRVCYLGLCIRLQSEQAAHLDILGVNHSGSDKVSRIWIDSVQQSHAKSQDLEHIEKENINF